VADPALYVEVLRADTDERLHGQAFDVAGRQLTPRKPLAKHLADDVETPTLPEGVAVILVWHAAGGNQEANDLLARLGAQGGELATDQSPQVGPRRVHRGGIDSPLDRPNRQTKADAAALPYRPPSSQDQHRPRGVLAAPRSVARVPEPGELELERTAVALQRRPVDRSGLSRVRQHSHQAPVGQPRGGNNL